MICMSHMSSTKLKLKQIVVDESNYKALKDLGKAGDSFNDVIKRLLKSQEKSD